MFTNGGNAVTLVILHLVHVQVKSYKKKSLEAWNDVWCAPLVENFPIILIWGEPKIDWTAATFYTITPTFKFWLTYKKYL